MLRAQHGVVGILALAIACGGEREPYLEPSRFSLLSRLSDPRDILYELDTGGGPVAAELVEVAMRRAVEDWEATGLVGFRKASAGENPQLRISWRRAAHGQCKPFGIDSSVAHTRDLGGELHVHLDGGRTWKLDGARDTEGIPLCQALLHELGHVLGLGHSPDDGSLLSPDTSAQEIQRSDLDGLRTLYSTEAPGPNDYVVQRPNARTCLYGLRVDRMSEAQFFDTDGDGRDEVLVWRVDPAGYGQLVAFFFDEDGRPTRTMGPRYGMVDGSAIVSFVTSDEGQRFIVLDYPNGTRVAYIFGGDPIAGASIPVAHHGALPAVPVPGQRRMEGDLDGDGELESSLMPGQR